MREHFRQVVNENVTSQRVDASGLGLTLGFEKDFAGRKTESAGTDRQEEPLTFHPSERSLTKIRASRVDCCIAALVADDYQFHTFIAAEPDEPRGTLHESTTPDFRTVDCGLQLLPFDVAEMFPDMGTHSGLVLGNGCRDKVPLHSQFPKDMAVLDKCVVKIQTDSHALSCPRLKAGVNGKRRDRY